MPLGTSVPGRAHRTVNRNSRGEEARSSARRSLSRGKSEPPYVGCYRPGLAMALHPRGAPGKPIVLSFPVGKFTMDEMAMSGREMTGAAAGLGADAGGGSEFYERG